MFKITYDDTCRTNVLFVLEEQFDSKLAILKEKQVFTGKTKDLYDDLNINNQGEIYLGLSTKLDLEDLRLAGFQLGQLLQKRKVRSAAVDFKNVTNKKEVVSTILEGLMNAQYKFDQYKSIKVENTLKEVKLNNLGNYKDIANETYKLITNVFLARDLVNMPAIDLYPESYANKIVDFFNDSKVEVEVYNKEEIIKLNMTGLLEVSRGSDKEPRFIVLKYFNDKKTDSHITFVGKGVTYDSGGYAIKGAKSMSTMNADMGGSASVVGAMKAISDNNLETNVVAVMALTENMIDGSAYKNGDIIKSMKGLTIEVVNTDAEGRITLADAIYYAATKLNSTKIVELSTLTGACVSAFGSHITGVVSNNDQLYEAIHNSGLKTGEFNWRMPVTKQLKDVIKSKRADLLNSVTGGAGMITAGIFLMNFAEELPFIHLDIAGTAYRSASKYFSEGATGVGVKTLYELVKA